MKHIFPIFPETIRFWVGSLGLIFFIAIIGLVWFGIVFQRFRRKLDLSYPEVINATALMTFHQTAISCLICGLLKRLQIGWLICANFIIIIGLVAVFPISFRVIGRNLREMALGARRALDDIQQDGITFIIFAAVLMLAVIVSFYVLILPPDSWDAYEYHLPMAALMIQEGHLGPYAASYEIINVYPKTAEMFFFIPMIFTRSDHWARLVQLIFMLFMIPGVYGLLRHFRLNRSQSFYYSALSLFFINNIYQAYRQWGNIDLILTSLFMMGIVLLAPRRGSPSGVFGRIALGLISALLCYSMKGNGILYLVFYCGMAFLFLARSGTWRTKYWLLPVLLFITLFPLWSYQCVQNYIHHKNPLYPVRVGFRGKTIFEGKRNPSEMMAVQLPKEIEGKDKYHALLRSWYLLITNSDFIYWGRLGGWGILWLFGIYPLSLLALAYLIFRREWDILRIVVPLVIFFCIMPSNWWVRYVGFIFPAGCILVGTGICRLNIPRFGQWLGAYLIILALATGSETIISTIDHESPLKQLTILRKDIKRRGSIATVDTFRKWRTSSPERDAYQWCVYELPPDSTLYYSWRGKDVFQYFFYRPDFNNKVYHMPMQNDEEKFLSHIAGGRNVFVTLTDNLREYQWLSNRPDQYKMLYLKDGISIFKRIE